MFSVTRPHCAFCTNNATSKRIILLCIIFFYEKLKSYSKQSFKECLFFVFCLLLHVQSHARVTSKDICLLFIILFLFLFAFCLDFVLFHEGLLLCCLTLIRLGFLRLVFPEGINLTPPSYFKKNLSNINITLCNC